MELVSVVMAVFNGEKYLKEALESILRQSYKNFEFVIIDDGSTDDSVKIIESYNEKRIILIKNNKNLGLPTSLNKGIEAAKGKYIARMDADDICKKDRLKLQVEFLEKNEDIDVLAGGVEIFVGGNKWVKKKLYPPECHKEIEKRLLYENCLTHPTIMMRKSFLLKNNLKYNVECKFAQDWALWLEATRYGKFYGLNKVLLEYRIHKKSITSNTNNKYVERIKVLSVVLKRELEARGFYFSEEEIEGIKEFGSISALKGKTFKSKTFIENTVKKLHLENDSKGYFDKRIFKNITKEKYIKYLSFTGDFKDYKESIFYEGESSFLFYKFFYKAKLKYIIKNKIWVRHKSK
ncbi:glycosyltransferase [Ilyobacter polytropus]|uniref:Glycosyl transferase family 2 n=1 Tax=Ilyobacter polytropus (strain ATCC 51220 / DSM 2926 / LMG 16218 / CuHBu1) TaxID=572544 RepID=E3HB28_ILYPC|nr:glycosyltransferase [Ilyobacter polytropus]ADO82177.1 glycosyl transferase family 2 [Ilyobacter polytropus DSM 2926]